MIDPVVELWLEHMHTVDRTPGNTIASRMRTMRSVGRPSECTREDLETWWRSRAELAPATRANDLANLRTFYKWCVRWEHRYDDPTLRLDAPQVENGLPRPIGRAELTTVLRYVEDDLRRAVALGAYAGVRAHEAAAVSWPDIDIETRRMRILGKGRKNRIVAMSVLLIDELLPDTGLNVVTGTEKEYSANALQKAVNRAIKAAGVDATFHQLRHRYGTIGYRATGDLLAVGRQMGHASPATTAVYAAESEEIADQIAEAVSR